jgi:hypothetical protein
MFGCRSVWDVLMMRTTYGTEIYVHGVPKGNTTGDMDDFADSKRLAALSRRAVRTG